MRLSVCAILAALVAGGCSSAPPEQEPPPFKPVADNLQLMEWILDPAADVIWESVGTIIDTSGRQDIRPETEEEWNAVRNAGAVVAESGNLLMMNPRAKDLADWMQYSQGLVDAGILAIKAAEARDPDAVFDAGGRIYAVCASCHQMYVEEDREAVLPR
jgi:hypothetical protein